VTRRKRTTDGPLRTRLCEGSFPIESIGRFPAEHSQMVLTVGDHGCGENKESLLAFFARWAVCPSIVFDGDGDQCRCRC
jgi:hypothetical protein